MAIYRPRPWPSRHPLEISNSSQCRQSANVNRQNIREGSGSHRPYNLCGHFGGACIGQQKISVKPGSEPKRRSSPSVRASKAGSSTPRVSGGRSGKVSATSVPERLANHCGFARSFAPRPSLQACVSVRPCVSSWKRRAGCSGLASSLAGPT